VHGMCHTIEDPTFDATAAATNPRAQVRPIHRPPRRPAGRMPHCAWRIDIVDEAAEMSPTDLARIVADSAIARLPISAYADDGSGGWPDYSRPFDTGFWLEDLSRAALLTAMDEFAVQSHLLLRAFLLDTGRRFGRDVAAEMLPRVVRGWCALTSERLQREYDLPETGDGIASLLALHPMFHPRVYTGFHFDGRHMTFAAAAAVGDADGATWLTLRDLAPVLESVVQGAFPSARVSGDLEVTLGHEPAEPSPELFVARISKGALFRFRRREPLVPTGSPD
jgi:hypothetical protein